MLYEFVTTYRDAIIARSKQELTARPWPTASPSELANGVPLFLNQLAEVLRDEEAGREYAPTGDELGENLRMGVDSQYRFISRSVTNLDRYPDAIMRCNTSSPSRDSTVLRFAAPAGQWQVIHRRSCGRSAPRESDRGRHIHRHVYQPRS